MDDETRRRIEDDLAAILPFTQIAARHGVSFVDVVIVHHRMRPQPVAWPEAVAPELSNEARAALRRADHRDAWLKMTFDTDRARLARLVIRKGIDRTVPRPELRPADFVAAWLDGDVRLDELGERMGLSGIEVRRIRQAAAEAAAAELGRLAVEREALAEVGRSTDELSVRAAFGVLLDWHASALDTDKAVEQIRPLGIPRLADAVLLASADPPGAVFIFAPAPFPDVLEDYEAARRRRDLEYVVVVEAGHSVRISTYSGSGAWISRTYRI